MYGVLMILLQETAIKVFIAIKVSSNLFLRYIIIEGLKN
jgi:hypothetical protein